MDPAPIALKPSNQARLDGWSDRLKAGGLPVFARTVREVGQVATSLASSAKDLSEVIGHDASMTTRLIQIANSSLFNLQNHDIKTINNAVVLIGFDAVRDLAISVSVIEQMLSGRQHDRLTRCMARAFHAAAQARSLANYNNGKGEAAFAAALLKEVGSMAFWSCAEQEAQALDLAMDTASSPGEAEREVLGFELRQLSESLATDWHLGDLTIDAISGQSNDPEVMAICLAHDLATLLETHSWESPAVVALVEQVAEFVNLSPEETRDIVCQNLERASAIADSFGVPKVSEALPAMPPASAAEPGTTDSVEPAQSEETSALATRFAYLDKIAIGLESGSTRDELMTLILQGICHGAGFATAFFALLNPDRTKLMIKYVHGEGSEALDGTAITLATTDLGAVVEAKKLAHLDSGTRDGWVCAKPVQCATVSIAGRVVGLVAAEEGDSAQSSVLRQFAQQISLVLAQTTG